MLSSTELHERVKCSKRGNGGGSGNMDNKEIEMFSNANAMLSNAKYNAERC